MPIQAPASGPASWDDAVNLFAHLDVVPTAKRGAIFTPMDHRIPKSVPAALLASRYPSSYPAARAEDSDLIEMLVVSKDGLEYLERLAKRLECEIPIAHGFRIFGEPETLRVVFSCPAYERAAIDNELRAAQKNTFQAVPLPGFRGTLTVRTKGLVPLPNTPIVAAPKALLEFLKGYRAELNRLAAENAIAEQRARATRAAIPAGSMKVARPVSLMFHGSYISLTEGQLVTEPELIATIRDIDATLLVKVDGKTGLRALKPGEIRFRTAFFRHVPELGPGVLDIKKDAIVEGDREYAEALKRAGADIEIGPQARIAVAR